jgi:hypothetical protein
MGTTFQKYRSSSFRHNDKQMTVDTCAVKTSRLFDGLFWCLKLFIVIQELIQNVFEALERGVLGRGS